MAPVKAAGPTRGRPAGGPANDIEPGLLLWQRNRGRSARWRCGGQGLSAPGLPPENPCKVVTVRARVVHAGTGVLAGHRRCVTADESRLRLLRQIKRLQVRVLPSARLVETGQRSRRRMARGLCFAHECLTECQSTGRATHDSSTRQHARMELVTPEVITTIVAVAGAASAALGSAFFARSAERRPGRCAAACVQSWLDEPAATTRDDADRDGANTGWPKSPRLSLRPERTLRKGASRSF